jgi:hypothetical protein
MKHLLLLCVTKSFQNIYISLHLDTMGSYSPICGNQNILTLISTLQSTLRPDYVPHRHSPVCKRNAVPVCQFTHSAPLHNRLPLLLLKPGLVGQLAHSEPLNMRYRFRLLNFTTQINDMI